MSFIDEIRQELAQAPQAESAGEPRLSFNRERFEKFLQEETSRLQDIIREDARAGRFAASGEKHVFEGTRLWHEGDYTQGTDSLATFYAFLARDTILEKEILEQQKRLLGGYRYAIRFSLTSDGETCFRLFAEALQKEGIEISGLFVLLPDGSRASLPYTARGTVKYDFELEHHLNDYPRLCYGWKMEL